MKTFKKILRRTEVELVQFFFYIGGLIYLWLKGYRWWSIAILHLFFVLFYGIYYFREDFLIFFLAPLTAVLIPVNSHLLKRYLRNFKQNIPAEVVIILGQSDFFKLEAWIKPNFFKSEIKWLVRLLKARKQDFSFYPKAGLKDVEKIMSDRSIKEVYFFGHGDSHTFQLNTDEILYYCEFNNPEKYGKKFVHQVHCGAPDGKSLIDYVVPKENRSKCFFFRKTIRSGDIEKEFKRRTKKILEKSSESNS
jgi:hypothetical protein